MKNASILLVALSVGILVGCQSNRSEMSQAPTGDATKGQLGGTSGTGLACALCVCSRFESQSDAANTCRMCGHAEKDHTRPVTTQLTVAKPAQ
ncbi:MAG: hypothetical protein U1G07_06865 [Verrucomicrobiota bacterium]